MKKKENHINRTSNTINIVAVTAGIIMLTIIYLLRLNLLPIISVLGYIRLLFFISVVFILPDYLNSCVKNNHKWYYSIEFYTILLLIFLSLSGFILKYFMHYISYLIIPIGVLLVLWELNRFYKYKNLLSIVFGLVSVGFFIVIFYSQGWHTPLFLEHIILGTAFIDILFHTSISNLFSTLGYASTGLDGAPYIHYHWGAHGLFAGLRVWINFSTISFYNIAYPLIFIPLFFKALLLFAHRIFIYKNQLSFDIILGFSVMVILYSLEVLGFTEARAMPMNSESFGVSLILAFLYGSTIMIFITRHNTINLGFITFSFIIILLLFLFKVSTGFVIFSGISFLLIRLHPNYKSLITVFVAATIIVLIVYLFIYPVFRNETAISIGNRLLNYWKWSASFVTYFMGILIFFIVLIYNVKMIKYSALISTLKTRKFIDLEVLAIFNLAGAGGALWVTSNSGDVYFFFAVQLFLSTVYILFYSNEIFRSSNLRKNSKNVLLAFLVIFSILATPQIISSLLRSNKPNRVFSKLSKDQIILKEFIVELIKLDNYKEKNNICIYIPQSEKWYYNPDSSFKEIFIVPAVSGISSINSISDRLLQSNFNYFSIAYYRNGIAHPINNLENAKVKARNYGYDELIVYTRKNCKLKKHIYPLN